MGRLLTRDERRELAFPKKGAFPGRLDLLDLAIEAQDAKTLKEVAKWLASISYDCDPKDCKIAVIMGIQTLNEGEVPE